MSNLTSTPASIQASTARYNNTCFAHRTLIPRVFICSPYRPAITDQERKTLPATELIELREKRFMDNLLTVLCGCAFAHFHGKIPLAPHAYFPRFLDDNDPEERAEGMRLGNDWLLECEELWVMGETISPGMKAEIELAKSLGIPIQYFIRLDISSDTKPDLFFLPTEEPVTMTT